MAKQNVEETDFSDVKVTLKPLFGIKPIHYLPVLYVVLIALIIFFFLIFPGISKHGTIITFKTLPDKAPVYIDDKYIGSTPCSVFVKSGNRNIVIKKPFYSDIAFIENVKGGIFGTLFFPLKKTLFRKCEVSDIDGLLQWAKTDLAQYGMLNDFTANYQFPPIISDAVAAIYGSDTDISNKMYNFLNNAMYFIDSEQEFWDFVHGFSIYASHGNIFSSFSVIQMAQDVVRAGNDYDGFLCWISGVISRVKPLKKSGKEKSTYDAFISSDWFTNYFSDYKDTIFTLKENETINLGNKNINVKGISCINVPGTTYVMGNTSNLESTFYPDMENLPHSVKVMPFYISMTEITNKDFLAFTNANPEWLPSNRDRLESGELATNEYLTHWSGNTPLEKDLLTPVTNISYFAATAFCEWLSSYLPSGMSGYTIRLPNETEWECVAKFIEATITPSLLFSEKGNLLTNVGKNPADTYPVKDIFGSVWEWCDNWFFPKNYQLFTQSDDSGTMIGSEKAVRGGCWANSKLDNIISSTRGSQPPSWCTPYLGFRIVVSEN